MSHERRRFLVLTPALDGADGISELSRQVVGVLVDEAGPERVDVWALDGEHRLFRPGAPTPAFRTAHGSRARMVRWALARASMPAGDVTVVVMHAHLAPVAGVLALRRAEVAVFLIGVEVWSALRARERRVVERAG